MTNREYNWQSRNLQMMRNTSCVHTITKHIVYHHHLGNKWFLLKSWDDIFQYFCNIFRQPEMNSFTIHFHDSSNIEKRCRTHYFELGIPNWACPAEIEHTHLFWYELRYKPNQNVLSISIASSHHSVSSSSMHHTSIPTSTS